MVFLTLVRLYRRVRHRRSIGVLFVLGLLSVSILGNAACYYTFDGPLKPDLTFTDALWYSVISITTIGYGDHSAESPGARLGTVFFVVVLGLTAFSLLAGMAIDYFSNLTSRSQRGMGPVNADNHILIVNFPSATRVAQLLDEIRADPQHRRSEIVLVNDRIERSPFDLPGVLFVRGSVLDQETYRRAKVSRAQKAVVLATAYDDPASDAVVASAVAVIDSLHPEVHIVAECLDPRHRMLFDTVHCDGVVFSLRITGNLLVQESQDPGVGQLVDSVTSNRSGVTLYSVTVEKSGPKPNYGELAKKLIDRDVNILCVHRGQQTHTSLMKVKAVTGDRVIYAASGRRSWAELLETAKN